MATIAYTPTARHKDIAADLKAMYDELEDKSSVDALAAWIVNEVARRGTRNFGIESARELVMRGYSYFGKVPLCEVVDK